MKTKRVMLLTVLLFYTSTLWAASDSTNVLFIGNSITYFNNMPQLFRNIANDKGQNVRVEVHAPGGAGIVNHYNNVSLYNKIASRKWDVVILQPGSGESAGASYPVDTTIKRARILLDSIYKNNTCTQVFLYQIPYGIPTNGGYPQYFKVQTMFRDSVTKMSDSLHLQMLPAGECFRAYYSQYQNLLLHSSINDIHPNAYGSFMVASAFYSGVFQDSVTGCNYYGSIPKDTALKFFAIADSVVLKHKNNWRINTYNLNADFSFIKNTGIVDFQNNSSNYTNLKWDFGDGNTSSLNNPSHTYNVDGTYKVKLIAQKNTCLDSAFSEISINTTSIASIERESGGISLYPNPAHDLLQISLPSKMSNISIYNVNGSLVYSLNEIKEKHKLINIASLSKGVYLLIAHSQFKTYAIRFIKR